MHLAAFHKATLSPRTLVFVSARSTICRCPLALQVFVGGRTIVISCHHRENRLHRDYGEFILLRKLASDVMKHFVLDYVSMNIEEDIGHIRKSCITCSICLYKTLGKHSLLQLGRRAVGPPRALRFLSRCCPPAASPEPSFNNTLRFNEPSFNQRVQQEGRRQDNSYFIKRKR